MKLPLYDGSEKAQKESDSHNGLWFERFFNRYNDAWEITPTVEKASAKQEWINTVTSGDCGNTNQLEAYALTQRQLCSAHNGASLVFKNDWHFVTGMGIAHPVENGMSWHPTLGTPYLTGAAVKGLVRAWVEQWAGLTEEEVEATCHKWFGSDNKAPEEQKLDNKAGDFIFFDTVPIKPVKLACDIMTPHMGEWYSNGGEISSDTYAKTLPADWHNPNPIPFLVVKETSLQFCIAPRVESAKSELKNVLEALKMALEHLGAGAKTAAGYGRFVEDELTGQSLEEKIKKADADRLSEQVRLTMTPLEKEIDDLISQVDNPSIILLRALANEKKWQENREAERVVAEKIKAIMESDGTWLPNFTGINKRKVKRHKRSLDVQAYLTSIVNT